MKKTRLLPLLALLLVCLCTGAFAAGPANPVYIGSITDVNGNVYYSGVLAYCAERAAYVGQNDVDANLADLYKRIAIYGDAARTYFGNR